MVIQIDAIDTVHILVADILAHAREDSPSQVMVFNVHDIANDVFLPFLREAGPPEVNPESWTQLKGS